MLTHDNQTSWSGLQAGTVLHTASANESIADKLGNLFIPRRLDHAVQTYSIFFSEAARVPCIKVSYFSLKVARFFTAARIWFYMFEESHVKLVGLAPHLQ